SGEQQLSGEITISGAKNAVLPILFSTLLLNDTTVLHNVPHLRDIQTTITLLEGLGVEISREGHSLNIIPRQVSNFSIPYDIVKTMRASILTLGPLLARYGRAEVSLPGGCAIGSRPVDMHLKALEKMGTTVSIENGNIVAAVKRRLQGSHILFEKVTVTGTENILMAAVLAEGETIIKNAAREPEIIDLANFLIAAGANIQGAGTGTITVQGVEALCGATHTVLADRIEAGTFLAAAMVTSSCLTLKAIDPHILHAVLLKFEEAGAKIDSGRDWITLDMRGKRSTAVDMITAPYPSFPTDMQAQLMAVNVFAEGTSTLTETIFENRFMHVQELQRMGADIRVQGNMAICKGKPYLTGAPVMATDLRASAGLVVAALGARGETLVDRVYHIDRGYDGIEKKLSQVGAKIERVR
ncbi:MAG: murA2, partial [Gammaproteobacteria bacterium]|nr:murA2 [Gammaproteobacteria bacterium]